MSTVRNARVALAVGAALGAGVLPAPKAMASESLIEEVVVTARKREESLQDVSAAVTAISGNTLREKGIADVRDLQQTLPTVNVGEVIGVMKIFIRGLGNTTNIRAEDPEVNLYVDGAVIGRTEIQSLAFFDLERIEVLRGPQGTLYGRNSTGGAINLISAKPTGELSGYANLTVGNYDLARFDGAIGGPLTDKVSARVAYSMVSRGGYGTNITSGHDIDNDDRKGLRVHLRYEPTDDVSVLLTGEWAKKNDNSGLLSFLRLTFPDNQSDIRMKAPGTGGFSDPASRDAAGNTDPYTNKETWALTGTLDWKINENIGLKNVFNYREAEFKQGQDLDLSSVVTSAATTPGIGTNSVAFDNPSKQVSEELQLLYTGRIGERSLRGIAGFFFYDSTYKAATRIGLTPTEQIRVTQTGKNDTRAWALFWNAGFDVTDRFTVRAGGRYNDEKRTIVNHTVLPTVVLTPAAANDERSFQHYTNEAGIDWRPMDDVMLYYTFSQGFRSGAGLLTQSTSGIADKTTVDSHEIGLKATWLGGRLLTNVAVFHAKAEGLQRTMALPDPGGPVGYITLFRNIPSYKTKGLELEFAAQPVDGWRLTGSASYIDAGFGAGYITQDPISPNTVLNPIASFIDVSGNEPQLTSKWRFTLGTEYEIPVGDSGALTLGAEVAYRSRQYYDDLNRAPYVEGAYALYNASIRYVPSSEKWSVSLWGKNLGDEKRVLDYSLSGLGRVLSKGYIDPRTYGATFNYRF